MKRALFSAVAIALCLLFANPVSATGEPDEVLLIVNGEPIPAWEVKLLMPVVQGEMANLGWEAKGSEVLDRTLRRAVDSLLLSQEARRRGIKPDEVRVDEKMKVMANEAGGRAELEAELSQSRITYDQLRSSAVQVDLVQTMVDTEIAPGIQVSEQDVETFYTENPGLFKNPDKVHSRHIVMLVESGATDAQREAVRQRAEAARARAVAGEDFAALAVELSEGPNAEMGGDLGFTAKGQMVEAFDNAVWALEPGQISEVVESRLGYHVIKVEEIVPGPIVPIDEARPVVADLLRQQQTMEALASFVAELRAKAEISEPKE